MRYFWTMLFMITFLNAQSFQSVIERLEQTPIHQRQRLIERYLNTKGTSPIIENDSLVHFVLYGQADSVFVNGNLQNWNKPVPLEKFSCGTFSLFYKTFVVPSDARLDYQYIIDGKQQTDPQNPRVTPSGYGDHSEIRMPNFIGTPYLTFRNNIEHGTLDSLIPQHSIPSPLRHYVSPGRPIKVYLPPGYDTLSHLPVVYVNDGFQAIEFASLPTVIDNLIFENKIQPIIAVFIPPVQRQDEYIGERRHIFVKNVSDIIVPMIDELYKTERSSLKRAIMGISNGGHISLYTVLSRPDIFQMAAGQSSTISPWLISLTQHQFENNMISPQMKIYLDCGRFDIEGENESFGKFSFLEMNRSYSNLLSSLHIPHYYKEVNDGHEWANWRERMPDILQYFFGTMK